MKRFAVPMSIVLMVMTVAIFAGCRSSGDPLQGTAWRLQAWSVSSIDPATITITLEFADGQISGSSGVNTYSGPYKTNSDGTFSTGNLAVTEIGGPEPAMRAERAYLNLLGNARSYEIADDSLTLFDDGGNESLIFERTTK